jgi:hypothetical protein
MKKKETFVRQAKLPAGAYTKDISQVLGHFKKKGGIKNNGTKSTKSKSNSLTEVSR